MKMLYFIRPFLAMASLEACLLWRCAFGLTKRLNFTRPFLAMASLKAYPLCYCRMSNPKNEYPAFPRTLFNCLSFPALPSHHTLASSPFFVAA